MSTVLSTRPSSPNLPTGSQPVSYAATSTGTSDRLLEMMKSLYQANHQVKFLHLQAEAEYLLQQVQTLKQQQPAVEKGAIACPPTDCDTN